MMYTYSAVNVTARIFGQPHSMVISTDVTLRIVLKGFITRMSVTTDAKCGRRDEYELSMWRKRQWRRWLRPRRRRQRRWCRGRWLRQCEGRPKDFHHYISPALNSMGTQFLVGFHLISSASTMQRLVVLLALAALSVAQYHHPSQAQQAAILSEQRYLSGDGTFGAAYKQEDGVEFKEEADQDGNRRGSYSYVDPSGQRRTIHYTAGKDGFRASGDHLPVAPAPLHPVPPQPQYQPQPQYNPPPQQYNNYQPQPQPQYNSVHQPQYNPTTPPPHRFYPPGKLNLNRTPDGFSYTFNKS